MQTRQHGRCRRDPVPPAPTHVGSVLSSISAISRSSGPATAWIVRVETLVYSAVISCLLWPGSTCDANIDILFEQMGGEAVPQRVRADPLADVGNFGSLLEGVVQLPRRYRTGAAAARKQPTMSPVRACSTRCTGSRSSTRNVGSLDQRRRQTVRTTASGYCRLATVHRKRSGHTLIHPGHRRCFAI